MLEPARILAATALVSLALVASPCAALPKPPSAAALGLIGQYGEPASPLTVYEKDGELFIDGAAFKQAPLGPPGADHQVPTANGERVKLHFEMRQGRAVAFDTLGGRFARHDFSAEIIAQIQATVKADPTKVRGEALAATPPKETGKRPADLVPLASVDPRIRLDIRYATANNFMGFPLYERPGAYMQRPAAEALGRAQKALADQGYGLLIHDAYRPWFVTKMFWDATPVEDHVFVADPAEGSKHNRGCAVDLSLYDLKTGKPVEMPSRYDEMSTRSYADFAGGTSRQRALRAILRQAMEAEGFTVYPQEWWHFDYKDWASYGIGTVTFTELAARR